MSFSNELRAASSPTWHAAVGHRFVEELWAGTVDDSVMAHYLGQDALFLDAFVALLGAAVASADQQEPRLVLARQLGLVAGEENDYFARALDRLGVVSAPVPLPATRGFLKLTAAAAAMATCPARSRGTRRSTGGHHDVPLPGPGAEVAGVADEPARGDDRAGRRRISSS